MDRSTNAESRTSNVMRALPARAKTFSSVLLEIVRKSVGCPADRYYPEQYYMRGPGPKWRA
jgi:hypothetical protein